MPRQDGETEVHMVALQPNHKSRASQALQRGMCNSNHVCGLLNRVHSMFMFSVLATPCIVQQEIVNAHQNLRYNLASNTGGYIGARNGLDTSYIWHYAHEEGKNLKTTKEARMTKRPLAGQATACAYGACVCVRYMVPPSVHPLRCLCVSGLGVAYPLGSR